ncbi:hypothetical protein BKA65DRAFT_484401 [Rhexocercosporidium sp. MPI-PUGE-AT-0058]|nr:hypothetical protein BKA65DRAFT_484401 [Rhexocercosporidium sp. MPI-PUGE-AT-0058]
MANPPSEEAPIIMSEPSESRTARRRREKRAKKNALSHSSDPANPALKAQAQAPAPKPQITKPHVVKPSISYGLQVSDLILRDTVQLRSSAPAFIDENECLPLCQIHSIDDAPAAEVVKPKLVLEFKTRFNASNTFKFAKLPAELRIMIEEYVFTKSSGMKPKMLKDIQACTIFSTTILLFPNLTHLNLRVHTTSGFSLSIHQIIPKVSHLRQVTVQIQGPKRIIQSHTPFDGAELFRSFFQTRIVLDKMLDRNGKCVRVGQRLQEWVWRAEGKDEVFKPRSRKVHIKFDDEAGESALLTEQHGGQACKLIQDSLPPGKRLRAPKADPHLDFIQQSS